MVNHFIISRSFGCRRLVMDSDPLLFEESPTMRYRYRNPVLLGQWFENREEAINDAIRVGLARRTTSGQLEWVDHASLEEEAVGIHQTAHRSD